MCGHIRSHSCADLQLSIELGSQVHEMEKGPQAEAHDEMLAVIERQDAAGVLFRKP